MVSEKEIGDMAGAQRTETAVARKPLDVYGLLNGMEDELKRALPEHLPVHYFLRIAITAARKEPKLMQANARSLQAAVMDAAQMGLPIDGMLGFAYLVPFWNKAMGAYEVVLIPGYRGLMLLAMNSGRIHYLDAHAVYAGDEFSYCYGAEPKLVHVPSASADRGAMIGSYAIAYYLQGIPQFRFVSIDDVEPIRKKAAGRKGDNPWKTHPDEMTVKTAMRRLCKFVPLSPQLNRAVSMDEAFEQARWADLSVSAVDRLGARLSSSLASNVETLADTGKASGEEYSEDGPGDADQGPTEWVTVTNEDGTTEQVEMTADGVEMTADGVEMTADGVEIRRDADSEPMPWDPGGNAPPKLSVEPGSASQSQRKRLGAALGAKRSRVDAPRLAAILRDAGAKGFGDLSEAAAEAALTELGVA